MTTRRWILALAVLAVLAAACANGREQAPPGHVATSDSAAVQRADSVARARQDSINRARPGYIVDSILPVEEEVRRFRVAAGGEPMTALHDGASSRDALIAAFARAISARDAAALRQLAVSPREFIDLIYPASPYTKPPYRQSPALLWSQIQLPSAAGARRLLDRLGGAPLRITALRCPRTAERQGDNRLHAGCTVRFASGNDAPRDGRLFGTILERHGQFKFVSFANMY